MIDDQFDSPAQIDWTWHCWLECCGLGTASGIRRHTWLSPCIPWEWHLGANFFLWNYNFYWENTVFCWLPFWGLPPHRQCRSRIGLARPVWKRNTFKDKRIWNHIMKFYPIYAKQIKRHTFNLSKRHTFDLSMYWSCIAWYLYVLNETFLDNLFERK